MRYVTPVVQHFFIVEFMKPRTKFQKLLPKTLKTSNVGNVQVRKPPKSELGGTADLRKKDCEVRCTKILQIFRTENDCRMTVAFELDTNLAHLESLQPSFCTSRKVSHVRALFKKITLKTDRSLGKDAMRTLSMVRVEQFPKHDERILDAKHWKNIVPDSECISGFAHRNSIA